LAGEPPDWEVGNGVLTKINIKTSSRFQFIDISSQVGEVVGKSGVSEGLCCVYVSHTTAGVTVNENADPAVPQDIIAGLDRVAPLSAGYRHAEGNSAAHIKTSLVGPSITLIIDGGRLVLGTWQSIFFCEFDGARNRTVHVKIVAG
jgi:secondary thiamine-phosphate synthase enzyme